MKTVQGKLLLPPSELVSHQFFDAEIAEFARLAAKYDLQMALTYLTATVASNMLSQIVTTGLFMGIHTASPGITGANEIVGTTMVGYSSGGYTGARMAVTWAAASSGVQTSNDTQTFPLLAIQAGGIPYYSLWTANGTGAATYLFGGPTSGLSGSIPNGANVTFTNGITLTQSG